MNNLDKIHYDLIHSLMRMVDQYFHTNSNGSICHACIGAEEYAIETLLELGFAREIKKDMNGYFLDWGKLKNLKDCIDAD